MDLIAEFTRAARSHLFSSMREGTPTSRRITIATRHAPYGMSSQRMAPHLHVISCVAVAWRWPLGPMIGARFTCGGDTTQPMFVTDLADVPRLKRCVRCDFDGIHKGERRKVVYYARRPDHGGAIKIGYSENLPLRLASLRAELLAWEPGGSDVEALRHRQFALARIAGEWFRPTPDLLAHIDAVRAETAA